MKRKCIGVIQALYLTQKELEFVNAVLNVAKNSSTLTLKREKRDEYIKALKKDIASVNRALKKANALLGTNIQERCSLSLTILEAEQLLHGLHLFEVTAPKKEKSIIYSIIHYIENYVLDYIWC